jgi:hypothetical protein
MMKSAHRAWGKMGDTRRHQFFSAEKDGVRTAHGRLAQKNPTSIIFSHISPLRKKPKETFPHDFALDPSRISNYMREIFHICIIV